MTFFLRFCDINIVREFQPLGNHMFSLSSVARGGNNCCGHRRPAYRLQAAEIMRGFGLGMPGGLALFGEEVGL